MYHVELMDGTRRTIKADSIELAARAATDRYFVVRRVWRDENDYSGQPADDSQSDQPGAGTV